MAVPCGPNGPIEGDEGPEDIFEDNGVSDLDDDVSPHLLPLFTAAKLGDVGALRLALDNYNGNIDDPIEDGDSLLHLCCLYGHLSCVQVLVERGANLESRDEEGAIPLHDACAGGFTDIVQFIIAAAAANNDEFVKRMLIATDAEGDTPLHHAARGEHLDVVDFLLTVGAPPTRPNIYGKIPGELAEPGTKTREILESAASTTNSGPCY